MYNGDSHLQQLNNISNIYDEFKIKSQKILIWNEANENESSSLSVFPS
jgi:hypothetical protein